jgi:zinc/manganese transport system substrate-binding protein
MLEFYLPWLVKNYLKLNQLKVSMKKLLSLTLAILALASFPKESFAKLNIFACEPEWKSLAEEIGGKEIEVISATNPFEDPHFIRAKPSLIAKMRQADLVFCSGAELEVGWLPVLLQKSGSSNVQSGQVGYFMASNYIKLLDIPKELDRSHGHIHAEGNPHVHLNPHNLIIIAEELSKRLAKLDSQNSSLYIRNFEKFKSNWSGYIKSWEEKAVSLKNLPIIVQHGSYTYLNDWLGLNQVADLEPKAGIPPTISHLESLLNVVKDKKPKAILLKPFDRKDGAEWLNEKTDIPIVILPYTVGGNNNSTNLKTMFDDILNKLLEVNK